MLQSLFKPVTFLAIIILIAPTATYSQIISLDANNSFQTITAWEILNTIATDQDPNFDSYNAELADRLANLGINRIRLESHGGREAVEAVNDNNDPAVINWNAFDFTQFDASLEKTVLPFKTAVEASGNKFLINLCFVEIGSNADAFHKLPEEYAEFVLAHFIHMDSKYGFVPDYVEAALEPTIFSVFDNNPANLANAIIAAGDRLAAAGYFPSFIAASNENVRTAMSWFDSMIQVPRISEYWKEYSHHLYSGWSDQELQNIGSKTNQSGLQSSMLEWWLPANDYTVLHRELKFGNVSAWQQGSANNWTDPAFTGWSSQSLFYVDSTDPTNPQFVMSPRTKFYSMYYRFIRPGAVRIEASSDTGVLDPVAFINANGSYTVVVKANNANIFAVAGLPAGTYGIRYTTNSAYDVSHADKTISAGQTLSTSIPEAGVITIFGNGGTLQPAQNARIENVTP